MLCEGMVLGVVGGLLSIGISILFAAGGNWALKAYVEAEIRDTIDGRLFEFSPMVCGAVLVLSVTLCAVAGLLPAIRASRMDSVNAMRKL